MSQNQNFQFLHAVNVLLFAVDEGGGDLFRGKTFVLFGFNEEYIQELTALIEEVQGKSDLSISGVSGPDRGPSVSIGQLRSGIRLSQIGDFPFGKRM